jgi:ribosome maturation factor RimP
MKKPLFRGFFVRGEKNSVAGKDQQIADMLQATVAALGYELWGVEYVGQGKHSVLRIFIDRPEGITVDDCAIVSLQAGSVLDVEDPISGEYALEVSSPGMDRLLFKLEQYPGYVGEVLDVRLRTPYEGRRKFKGVMKGIEGEDIVLQVDDHEYLLPHSAIDKARVEPGV